MMAMSKPPWPTRTSASATVSQVAATLWPSESRKSSSIIAISGSSSTMRMERAVTKARLRRNHRLRNNYFDGTDDPSPRRRPGLGETRRDFPSRRPGFRRDDGGARTAPAPSLHRQRVTRRLGQLLHGERLGEEGDPLEVDRLAQLLLGIAGDEQDRQVRLAKAGFARRRRAVHRRYDDVGDHQVDPLLPVQYLDRGLAILGEEHGVEIGRAHV